MCAICSFTLKSAFKHYKLPAQVVLGKMKGPLRFDQGLDEIEEGQWYHCWLIDDMDVIWDLTATQFGGKDKVLTTRVGDSRYSRGKFVGRDQMLHWPIEQYPSSKKIKKILGEIDWDTLERTTHSWML